MPGVGIGSSLHFRRAHPGATLESKLLAFSPVLLWRASDAVDDGSGNVASVPAYATSTVAYEQTTLAERPTLIASHPTFGGLAGIEIDDAAANLAEVTTGAIGTLTDAVICWVVDVAIPGFGATDWLLLDASGNAQVYTVRDTTGTPEIGIYDGTAHRVVTGITSGVHLLTAVLDAGANEVQFRIDGADVGAPQTYDGSIAFTGQSFISYNGGAASLAVGSVLGAAVILPSATTAARDAAEAYMVGLFGFNTVAYDPDNPEHIAGTGGQSNMALADTTQASSPRIRAWDADTSSWVEASNGGGGFVADLYGIAGGIASSFAYEMCIRLGNQNASSVGIINNPLSGTPIASLLPGTTVYDDWAAEVATSGRTLDSYLWYQGESDDGRSEAAHLADLETLYAAVMSLATSAAMPFIVFDLVSDTACAASDLSGVRAALAALAANHANVTLITTSDLPSGDACHLTDVGRVTAGQRAYQAAVA